MTRKNPHIGSTFESWLDEAGIREEVTAAAIQSVIARQIAGEMKKQRISKARMAELMRTSRAQVDRLLDPENGSATLETLIRAARILTLDDALGWQNAPQCDGNLCPAIDGALIGLRHLHEAIMPVARTGRQHPKRKPRHSGAVRTSRKMRGLSPGAP